MKKIYLLLIFLPHILFADTSDNPPCLQTLICNVNGTFLKDNKDNRACIKELIITQTNNDEQESDVMPMCLSQATMQNNPQIDFNLGRIDPIPPVVELPETPKFLPPGEFAIMDMPRERKGDSKVITRTGVIKEMPPPAQDQKPPPAPLVK